MDLMVIALVGLLTAIFSALYSLIKKKGKWKFMLFGAIGLVLGAAVGYMIAPYVISFL